MLLDRDGEDVPVCFKLYGYNRLRRSLQRLFKASRWSGNQLTFNFFMVWVYQHVRLLRVVNTEMCSAKTLDDNADAHMVSILLS